MSIAYADLFDTALDGRQELEGTYSIICAGSVELGPVEVSTSTKTSTSTKYDVVSTID